MPTETVNVPLQTLPISDLGIPSAALRISGPDANTFLQGQFTQELRSPVGSSSYGLWLNQKGKVVADSFVLRLAEQEFLIWAARTAPGVLRERLEGYLIADEVEIEDVTETHGAVALWGRGAAALVATYFGALPATGAFSATPRGLVFRGRMTASENFICLVPNATEVLDAFERGGAVRGTRDSLEAERIASGVPSVPEDVGPNDLPNEAGLDVDAISFTKGCYLGQEVMSRLKNLGQVRRRLLVLAGDGTPPASRTPLHQGEKQVGETRSSARVSEGFVAMAMLSLVSFDRSAPLTLPDSREVQVRYG